MEVKLLLILLLVLVLLLNFYTSENFFNDHRSDDQNPIAKHIGEELGRMMDNKNYFDVSEYIDIKITNQNDRDWYLERGNFSLPKNKILITLFYDPNDRFSRMFYDDTEKIYEDYILKEDEIQKEEKEKNKKIWNRIKEHYENNLLIEEVKMDKGQMNSFNDIESRVIEYVEPNEILEMADYNEIQKYPRITQSLVKSLEPKNFNSSKEKVINVGSYSKTDDDDKVQDIYTFTKSQIDEINEILNTTSDRKINFRIRGNYKKIDPEKKENPKEEIKLDIYDKNENKIGPQLDVLFTNKDKGSFKLELNDIVIPSEIGVIKLVHIWNDDENSITDLSNVKIYHSYNFGSNNEREIKKEIRDGNSIEIRHPKRQPPRPKDLLDKLPKIIASYVKNNKQYITEYDSYYNFGNEYKKVAVENFIDFVNFINEKKKHT